MKTVTKKKKPTKKKPAQGKPAQGKMPQGRPRKAGVGDLQFCVFLPAAAVEARARLKAIDLNDSECFGIFAAGCGYDRATMLAVLDEKSPVVTRDAPGSQRVTVRVSPMIEAVFAPVHFRSHAWAVVFIRAWEVVRTAPAERRARVASVTVILPAKDADFFDAIEAVRAGAK